MQYIHIKNLEKFHPGYKDRTLLWAKIHFNMVQGDPDCEMIDNEIDWARLIKFILLELQAKKPLPLDPKYLVKKGFNLKKRPIALTLQVLHNFVNVSTEENSERAIEEKRVEENREEKKREEKLSFGKEFQKVKLTKAEFDKLTEKFENRTASLIDNLDSALASKGYKYSSHYATILNWERRDSKLDSPQKTKLFPIAGKNCEKCGVPAVWKNATGAYDHCYCLEHSPQAVRDKYRS